MSRYEWTDAEPSNEYVRFTSIMEVSFGSKDIRVVLDDYSPDLVGVVYVNGEKYYEMDYDDDDVAICDLEDKVDELKRVNKMKFNDMIKQRRYGIRKSDGEWAPICRDIMAELDQISSEGMCVFNDVMEGGMENSCPRDPSYAIFDALDHFESELCENGCEEDSEHIENVYALIQKERGLMALVAQRIDEWYDFESFYTMFEDIINGGY